MLLLLAIFNRYMMKMQTIIRLNECCAYTGEIDKI